MENSRESQKPNVILVNLQNIKVKDRGRKEFKNIEDLMESIKNYGLAHPLVVSKDKDDKYNLVAGERRLRACLLLGMETIPCSIREDLSTVQQKELELEENIQREDLNWSERNEIRRQLDEIKRAIYGEPHKDEKGETVGWTTAKTAELVGESRSGVHKQVKFAKDLKERPDIAKKVMHLPEHAAKREYERLLEVERLERLKETGRLDVKCELLNVSCLEGIKDIPDESVAMILTDPPYGIQNITQDVGKKASDVAGSYRALLYDTDNLNPMKAIGLFKDLCPDLYRVLIPGGHFYVFFTIEWYTPISCALIAAGIKPETTPIIWDKGRTSGVFTGYQYVSSYEAILYGMKAPRDRRLSEPCKNILSFPPINSQKRLHPFEKPQDLLRYLIRQSSRVGETVLDPFAGSGSTILAAQAEGRKGLGFELSNERYLMAQSRLILEEANALA